MNTTSNVVASLKPPIERFWKAQQAAEYLGMSRRTMLAKVRRGEIPGHPRGRGKRRTWLFLATELRSWVMGEYEPQRKVQ